MASIGVRLKIIEPGMTRTDFSGRSFQFSQDEAIAEYGSVVAKTMTGFAAFIPSRQRRPTWLEQYSRPPRTDQNSFATQVARTP